MLDSFSISSSNKKIELALFPFEMHPCLIQHLDKMTMTLAPTTTEQFIQKVTDANMFELEMKSLRAAKYVSALYVNHVKKVLKETDTLVEGMEIRLPMFAHTYEGNDEMWDMAVSHMPEILKKSFSDANFTVSWRHKLEFVGLVFPIGRSINIDVVPTWPSDKSD